MSRKLIEALDENKAKLVRFHACGRNPHLGVVLAKRIDRIYVAWTFNRQTGGLSHGCYGPKGKAEKGFQDKIALFD